MEDPNRKGRNNTVPAILSWDIPAIRMNRSKPIIAESARKFDGSVEIPNQWFLTVILLEKHNVVIPNHKRPEKILEKRTNLQSVNGSMYLSPAAF